MKRHLPLLLLLFAAGHLAACHAGPGVFSDSDDTPDAAVTTISDTTPDPGPGNSEAPPPSLPPGSQSSSLDNHFFIGSVSEDSSGDLNFWRTHGTVRARYIYINGGFSGGWRTWGANDGDRAINFIRNSNSLGMIPFFVYYQIPGGGGESPAGDLSNIQSSTYMRDYFLDLKFFLDIVKREGNGREVGIVLEPDFLGYMMQNYTRAPSTLTAQVTPAYAAGVLTNSDPQFPNTLKGLVEAINYTITKYAPNALFGWEVNVWASPGIHHGIPVNGLCRVSDSVGVAAAGSIIRSEAAEVAQFYKNAGILSQNAKWVFIDKYGLDGTGNYCSNPSTNPSACIWFWNSDHWNNYVTFIDELHEGLQTPIVLWQIPVGHLNNSQFVNPATGQTFPPLRDVARSHEDSAPDFIFGNTFQATTSQRLSYFGSVSDVKTTKTGNTITIQSHADEFIRAGVVGVLFGAGVGLSTDFDSDDNWWITKVKEYYRSPKRLD